MDVLDKQSRAFPPVELAQMKLEVALRYKLLDAELPIWVSGVTATPIGDQIKWTACLHLAPVIDKKIMVTQWSDSLDDLPLDELHAKILVFA